MKHIVLITLLCIGFTYVSAQEVYNSSGKPGFHKKAKKKGYDPSKLVVGGGLNAVYSSGYAVAGLSPIVGYRFQKHFVAGVGLGYLYSQAPDYYFPHRYDKEHIIYPNLWARYFVYRGLYVIGAFEFDIIKYSQPNWDMAGNVITEKANYTAECLLGGLGLKQPLGGRVSIFVEIVHEFLAQQYSPYLDPRGDNPPFIFHVGVCAGL